MSKTGVLTGGSFDPLHGGHIAYLREAARVTRQRGVWVAVETDARILARKGRPACLPLQQRMEVVGALEIVSGVMAQDETGEAGLIDRLRPEYYVKGREWEGRLPGLEREVCARLGITPIFVDTPRESSTARLTAYVQAVHEQGLTRLEQVIATQRPAAVPWQPTAAVPYDFESRQAVEGRHPELIRDVFKPTAVLDVGCGPGHLVRLLRGLRLVAWGVDLATSAEWCQGGWNVASPPEVTATCDLVICREVVEHLSVLEIRQAVTTLCRISSRFVYLTTRFNQAPTSLFDVQQSDDLDPTHISMLSQIWLRSLFVLEGFRRRADLEAAIDWQHKGRVLVYERAA